MTLLVLTPGMFINFSCLDCPTTPDKQDFDYKCQVCVCDVSFAKCLERVINEERLDWCESWATWFEDTLSQMGQTVKQWYLSQNYI